MDNKEVISRINNINRLIANDCRFDIEDMDALRLAIAALSGWVKVEDRLPERYECVYAYYDNGDMAIVERTDMGYAVLCWLVKSAFIHVGNDIAHWMPLPASPCKDTK
jgi:hypothetical protein